MKRRIAILVLVAAAAASESGRPVRPGDKDWPVAWATYNASKSVEDDFADLKAHGVGLVNSDAGNVERARQALEIARRFGMKYHTGFAEITESAALVKQAKLEPVDAILIGGVYRGQAMDRTLFQFTAAPQEITIEPPVYHARFAYSTGSSFAGPGANGEPIGHYFPDMPAPLRAEVVVPLRAFNGKQHLKIVAATIEQAPPDAKLEQDSVTPDMPASSETRDRKLYRVKFDLTGLGGAMLDKVGVAVYWPYHGTNKYWIFSRGDVSAAAESTRAALRVDVDKRLNMWREANGGSFPIDTVIAARWGDECFYITSQIHTRSAAVNYPLWEYSQPEIDAFHKHAGAMEYPRTWGFPEIYGEASYGWWLYTLHEQCAALAGVIREEVAKLAPGLLVFRNTTRSGIFSLANDHDGSGPELLTRNLDIVHLDPYPVHGAGYDEAIPRDMSYYAGLARRYHRILVPWMQAHTYGGPAGLVHVTPDQVDRMAKEQYAQGVDAVIWLGYGGNNTFPKVNPEAWERAGAFHKRLAAGVPKVTARLAVLRGYSAWGSSSLAGGGNVRNPADWMLQQFLEVWAVERGLAYDVFEVAPGASIEKELRGYKYVVSTVDWPKAWVIGKGTASTVVEEKSAGELRKKFAAEMDAKGWK
ncbi:MAG: hypothetical protein JWP63_2453 [Candidatus Solibacter sp.]|nr:hypothetical protein [Candidatus Solibacter sp.]